VFASMAGEESNVTQSVNVDVGTKTAAPIVTVKMGRVIPRMASVLVPGDLLDQNVTYLVLEVFMVLTANKRAPLATRAMEIATIELVSVNVLRVLQGFSAWNPVQVGPMAVGVWDSVLVEIAETVTMSLESADVLEDGWGTIVHNHVLQENLALIVFMIAIAIMVLHATRLMESVSASQGLPATGVKTCVQRVTLVRIVMKHADVKLKIIFVILR